MLYGACDIIPNFVLKSGLTFAENILLNYLISTKDKGKAIGMTMNFVSRSAAQRALRALTNKYELVDITPEGTASIRDQFNKFTMEIHINNATGRPKKLSKANMK